MVSQGTRIGPYELGVEVGRGASGVVYAATDAQLGRKVALKVLSDDVARTPEQRARFAREARLLAAVSHPNVAVVYGVVEEGERVWLALEFLEGETLADALEHGPLSVEDALDVARQVADGLEAAHESGVVHRDLKPANIKRAPDGTVKVLDFGLAKPVRQGLADSSELSSDGLVLGTPLYMSPEQLRGKPIDRRADVWAFGCVLWELLTGQRAFAGETTADVLHAILEHDPDLSQLPANTPERIRELLQRCLRKDARKRLRDVGDARLELETALAERAWVQSGRAPRSRGGAAGHRRHLGVALAALLVAAAAGILIGRLSTGGSEPPRRVLRLALDVPAGPKQTHPRVTPDGSALVHEIAVDRSPQGRHLVMRRFDSFDDIPIPGTERVDTYGFSADGERLAVVRTAATGAGRFDLLLVPLEGSAPPVFVGALPPNLNESGALAWLDDGRIVMSSRPRKLLIIHTDGSGRMDEIAVQADEEQWPQAPEVLDALPGARVLASSMNYSGRSVRPDLVALDVDSGEQTVVAQNVRYGAWQPSGHLLFSRADVLLAAPFDPESLALLRDPEPVATGLRTESTWLTGPFQASREGTVVWEPGGMLGATRSISWVTADREPRAWSEGSHAFDGFLQVDETGTFMTVVVVGPSGNYELWGSEIDQPRLRPLRSDPGYDHFAAAVFMERREMFFTRFGQAGAEVRRESLDTSGEGTLLLRDQSEGVSLLTPRLVDAGRLLTVSRFSPEGRGLIACDLSSGPPFEFHTVFEGTGSVRRVQLSADARWLLVSDRNDHPTVRRHGADGSLGVPQPIRTSGPRISNVWWARADFDGTYRLHLMPPDSTSVFELEMKEEQGELVFTEPRRLLGLEDRQFWDAAHVGEDRYLAILRDLDEVAQDTVHVLIGALDARFGN